MNGEGVKDIIPQEKAKSGPGFASALFCAGNECGEILLERSSRIGVPWQRVTAREGLDHGM